MIALELWLCNRRAECEYHDFNNPVLSESLGMDLMCDWECVQVNVTSE